MGEGRMVMVGGGEQIIDQKAFLFIHCKTLQGRGNGMHKQCTCFSFAISAWNVTIVLKLCSGGVPFTPLCQSLPTHCVEKLQFPWKHDSVRQLCVALAVFHKLEPLEVKGQDLW